MSEPWTMEEVKQWEEDLEQARRIRSRSNHYTLLRFQNRRMVMVDDRRTGDHVWMNEGARRFYEDWSKRVKKE